MQSVIEFLRLIVLELMLTVVADFRKMRKKKTNTANIARFLFHVHEPTIDGFLTICLEFYLCSLLPWDIAFNLPFLLLSWGCYKMHPNAVQVLFLHGTPGIA